jgi:signal transduction histidine kinase
MLITSGLGGFGIGPVPATEPADVLVSALLAGGLVWRGVTATEVESGFSPLVTLATSIGAGVSVAGISSALQVDRLVPWWISGQAARPILTTVAGAAWLAVATRAAWSAGRFLGVPMWISLITGLIGIGTLLRADPQLGAGAGLTGAVVVFCAMSLVLGTVLARVQSVLRIEDHQQFRLHRALAGTRRQAASEHEELEEWLHDLRNAVAGLRAADAVLRAGAGGGPGPGLVGREPLAEAVTAELARLHALVGSPRTLRPSDLDLGSVLAPVVAAERMLGAQIDADLGGLHAFADQGALSRVVQNVLENARRYAPSSRVMLTAREVGPRVQVTIRDFGPGIPEAERGAVFGRAERGASAAGTAGGGLGLHVAQSLLSAMGARAWITDDSPGCCMLVTLPRMASVAGGRGQAAPAYGPGRLPTAV